MQTTRRECFRILAQRALKCGLKYPTEPTFAVMAAILEMCRYQGDAEDVLKVDPSHSYNVFLDMKTTFKSLRTGRELRGPDVFMPDPMDLRLTHPNIFAIAFPVGPGRLARVIFWISYLSINGINVN